MSATLSKVEVPDIGDFSDVPIIEILVSEGDTVAAEDPLVTLESDKATMDVPAPLGGVVREILVSVGDRVSEGSPLMSIEATDVDPGAGEPAEQAAAADRAAEQTVAPSEAMETPERPEASAPSEAGPSGSAPSGSAPSGSGSSGSGPAAPPPSAQPVQEPGRESAGSGAAPASPAAAETQGNGGGPIYASPSARRLARELGVDLHRVEGSGRKGRITKEDVQRLAEAGPPAPAAPGAPAGAVTAGAGLELLPWPSIDFEKFGPVERVTRSRIQRISAPNLARNWVMIPHVTHNDEADITDLEAWRKQLNKEHEREGVKFTMVSFLIAASVAALKAFPDFNSSLDGEELVLKKYYNIGFAADTPGGLVVPVIKGADTKGLKEIALELTALSSKAREGKLGPADMSGSTFTISSLGGIGGTSFTPIVNAPEVAILGVTRAAMKPVWNSSEFEPRLMVPLSLSYDHRVIDGAAAARFVSYLVGVLSDLRRVLL
ncbi:MAG TPA: dihydrolipoyllysine-residue acetyltransferase [Solirubrobacteraceae bacterium]|nr:dihydrolipoyllysine-residue acetyltransferase [Solirubrobacteraceae bacterium]